MEVKTTNLGSASQTPQQASGEHSHVNFRKVFASVQERPGDTVGQASSPKLSHRVRSGETLIAIAQNQLISSGQNASPDASMRQALKIAKDNHIQNPDRIYAGQTLALDRTNFAAQPNKNLQPLAAVDASLRSSSNGQKIMNVGDIKNVYGLGQYASETMNDANDESPIYTGASALSSTQSIEAPFIPPATNTAQSRNIDPHEQNPASPATGVPSTASISDIIYKGVVGKMLDSAPLESSTRTALQQANSVVGNSFAGRALATLTGVGGPILTVAGLLWGLFSAQKIGLAANNENKQAAQTTNTTSVN
jgi:LysM repeat protein